MYVALRLGDFFFFFKSPPAWYVLVREVDKGLILFSPLLGYPGHAEPAYPLSEDETFTGSSLSENAAAASAAEGVASVPEIKDNVGETAKSPLHTHGDEVEAARLGRDTAGLSPLMKLGLAGLILAACYAWVRGAGSSSAGAGGVSGRHGAYEKSLA